LLSEDNEMPLYLVKDIASPHGLGSNSVSFLNGGWLGDPVVAKPQFRSPLFNPWRKLK